MPARMRFVLALALGIVLRSSGSAQPLELWPPPLSSHVMAYVPSLSRVVLFGGSNPAREMSSRLWSWDGSRWATLGDEDTDGPSPRIHAGMAYDLLRGRLVVFGGIGADGTTLADVWEWDGERWQAEAAAAAAAGSGPGARDHHALAYDPVLEKVILYGGQDASDRYRADTWSWDGSDWVELASDAEGPPARSTHRLATDTAGRRVLLFGGWAESGLLDDLWEWNGHRWSTYALPDGPPPTGATRYAFDDSRDTLVIFGGRVDEQSVADTWLLEPSGFRRVDRPGPEPEARNVHAMSYDASRQRVVLYGGIGDEGRRDDLWEWDGAGWRHVARVSRD